MRLEKHLPSFINGLKQFKEIDKTHTAELDKIDTKLIELQDNQFIETANNKGLSRYENMLGIQPDNDIDIRRFNILSKYNSSIPFSMRWLINMLNTTVGKGMYLLEFDNNHYTLTISVVSDKEYVVPSLLHDLRKKLPANLIIKLNILNSIDAPIYTGFIIRTGDKQMI